MAELKPCPFCGGVGRLFHSRETFAIASYVYCEKCRCRSEPFYISTEHSSDDKAIEAWNRRAGDGDG